MQVLQAHRNKKMSNKRIYKNKGNMWMNVHTGEKNIDGKSVYDRIDIHSIIPEIPEDMWLPTNSGKSEYVDLNLDKFGIVEELEINEYPAITTDQGTILSPANKVERKVYKLVSKTRDTSSIGIRPV